VADANYQASAPRRLQRGHPASCKFLHRDDLGRFALGAKADIVLINLDHPAPALRRSHGRWWTAAAAMWIR
jgi:cytosine/adenosine deaminase-related metal-dependent hydrolase